MGNSTPSHRKGKPPFQWWSGQADGLGLKKTSSGLAGPCPLCGGDDRFYITRKSGEALIGCRQCGDGKTFLPDVLKAVGWVDDGPGPQRMQDQEPKRNHGPPVPPVSVYDDDMAGPADPPGPAPEQKETGRWTYRNLDGETVTVRRMEPGRNGRKKDFPRTPTGLQGPWLPLAGYDDSGPLLIVEGEGCCDRARELGFNCTTWQGGTGAAGKTHWAGIVNSEVTLFPDNDNPGRRAMGVIAAQLSSQGCTVRMCNVSGLPEKGDIADIEPEEASRIIEAAKPWTPPAPGRRPLQQPGKQGGAVSVVPLADIPPERIEWVIPEWLPASAITLLAGAPGEGKTTVAARIAAMVSTGSPWPGPGGGNVQKGKVIFFSGEDDLPRVVVPNIIANNGDLEAVFAPVYQAAGDDRPEPRAFDPAVHLNQLAARIDDETKLLIIDPAMSIASKARDEYRPNDIRAALKPLEKLAAETGIAVLCITHFAKSNGTTRKAWERVIGSSAWVQVARASWVIDDLTDGGGKALMRMKMSWAPSEGGMKVDIQSADISDPRYGTGITGRAVTFGEAVEGTADEVMARTVTQIEPRDAPALDSARDFLAQYFEAGNSDGWKTIEAEGKRDGHTAKTLRRARDEMKTDGLIQSARAGFGGAVTWSKTDG